MAVAESPSTSPTLLEMLGIPRNEEAWRVFLRLYRPLIDKRCRKARLQDADMEEVRSRVLTALTTAMEGFKYDPARRFRGYLGTVVNNAIRALWRERNRRPGDQAAGGDLANRQLSEIELPAPLEQLGEDIDADLQKRLLLAHRVINVVRSQVDAATWDAYWRTAVERQAPSDVAAQLGKSVRAVYMAKCRVKRMLHEQGQILTGRTDGNAEHDV
jgi:RNA polymerase sigma factor (sigma-70 family)